MMAPPSSRGEFTPQVLDAVDEARQQPDRLPRHADVRELGEQLPEHLGDLTAGQVRAEAVVRTAAAEAEMRVRLSVDVEALGVGEDSLVPVGRRVEQQQ